MNLYCLLTGRHRWSRSTDDIPATTAFLRIDCLRRGCDFAVDGVAIQGMKKFLRERDLLDHSIEKRLP